MFVIVGEKYKLGFMRTYKPCYIGSEDRSSRSQMFFKMGVLENFLHFTRKQLWRSLFLIKLQALSPVTILKETPTQVFCCKICKIIKTPFLTEHLQWLFLWKEAFLKKRKHSKIRLYFNIVRQMFPYMIKEVDRVEAL